MKIPFLNSTQNSIAAAALKKIGMKSEDLIGAQGAKIYGGTDSLEFDSISPIDNKIVATAKSATADCYEQIIKDAELAFVRWRNLPAPKRAEIIREIGNSLRTYKEPLAQLVCLETGKLIEEARGEVQEAIDMADFSQGLGRQLYGLVIQSERPEHRMFEQWHPLGIVGVISAFNYPVAVWSWNAFLGAVCGDVIVWKPSELAPISALAANFIARQVAAKYEMQAVFSLVLSEGKEFGTMLAADRRVALVSATGSVEMGKSVAQVVAARLGKTLLELGGNNGVIVMDDANLDLALESILFGAVGTAGQRCTSIRRIFVHEKIQEEFTRKLIAAYKNLKIGDPFDAAVQVGPVKGERAVNIFQGTMREITKQSGQILCGGKIISNMASPFYVEPTLVRADISMKIIAEENFAPIAYLVAFSELDQAIAWHNSVRQGLSSAIFTSSIANSERFLSVNGSDCGIANVNLGTSGAEIGGAFGGEKDTGGGRESGSDCWKYYMRRQTSTINYAGRHIGAQGVRFSIKGN